MKNIEKYQKEITNHIKEYGDALECVIATVAGIRKEKCYPQDCEVCQKKCLDWMYLDYIVLTKEEKEIVESIFNVIHKFGCKVIAVRKRDDINGDCYIRISFRNIVTGRLEIMDLPYLNNDMFKGMELGKEYTLEELGITCPTQKDS